jgi:hypothetical protein
MLASIYLLTRQGSASASVTAPKQLQELLKLFDALTPEQARAAVRFWRADRDYLNAIAAIDEQTPP